MFPGQQKCWNMVSYRCIQSVSPSLTARVPRLHLQVCYGMPHNILLSPACLAGEEAARVRVGAKLCVCWLVVRQDEKNIELILQLQQGKLFLSLSCPIPLPMVSMTLRGINFWFFSVVSSVPSSFVWQGGSNSPNRDWQAGRQMGGQRVR